MRHLSYLSEGGGLEAGFFAPDDRYVFAGDAQRFGEEGDERGVGFAVFRGGGDFDAETAFAGVKDLVF
jgi:hypothetical protein